MELSDLRRKANWFCVDRGDAGFMAGNVHFLLVDEEVALFAGVVDADCGAGKCAFENKQSEEGEHFPDKSRLVGINRMLLFPEGVDIWVNDGW